MSRLTVKLFCKAVEGASRVATWVRRPFASDATKILLDNFTTAQKAAKPLAGRANNRATKLLVLIPFRDQWPVTASCLATLGKQKLSNAEVQVLLIDNGSRETATSIAIAQQVAKPLANGVVVKALRVDEPFNFSRLNNLGVEAASAFGPDYLLFLNNDVDLLQPDDLERLLLFADANPKAGAIGCTLLFPDQRIQHLFLAPGIKIVGAHPLKGCRLKDSDAWFQAPRPVPAVTGAALLVARDAFQEVGGFDESLPTVGQDLDLCLKLQQAGRINWVLPHVKMLHKEGATRGKAIAKAEVGTMYAKWGEFLTKNPYYSDRLSRFSETPAYRLLEPAYPWEKVL